jgi:hypothetical protein
MTKRGAERLAGAVIVIQGVIGIVSWAWGLWALPPPAPSPAGPSCEALGTFALAMVGSAIALVIGLVVVFLGVETFHGYRWARVAAYGFEVIQIVISPPWGGKPFQVVRAIVTIVLAIGAIGLLLASRGKRPPAPIPMARVWITLGIDVAVVILVVATSGLVGMQVGFHTQPHPLPVADACH